MSLVGLTHRLKRSLEQIGNTAILDKILVKNCLKEITDALVESDFPESHVNEMERKIQEIINIPDAWSNKYRSIYQIILREICSMLDPGKSALIQEKRDEPSIVMFIGLRGVGKTDICGKYARYHLKKGFKPALVCADTFRIDASVRLNKAVEDKIPVYASCTQDPAKLVAQGIEKFSKEKRDLIIIYTNDRHKQYSPLFKEMSQLAETMKPDLVIYVMDSSIGEAAFEQAQAFKQSFTVGVVIVTNIEDNSKACGTLCAVAAAKCPMVLAETGEKSNTKFEAFEAEPFVTRLLWGDHREYTLRKMYESYQSELGIGYQGLPSVSWVRDVLGPKVGDLNLKELRQHMTIMDSMTDEELDRPDVLKQMSKERVMEIAKESKVEVRQVVELMKMFKREAKGWLEMEEAWSMTRNNLTERMKMIVPFQVGSTTTTEQIKPVMAMPFDPLSIAVRKNLPRARPISIWNEVSTTLSVKPDLVMNSSIGHLIKLKHSCKVFHCRSCHCY